MSEELKPCPFCGGKAALRMSWMEDGHRYRAVECVECGATTPGNYSEVGDQSVWDWNTRTPEQVIAATLGNKKAKAHPYGYEPDTGAFDVTRCECGCLNDISATYCNDCGGEIEIDINAEKEIYHTPQHSVFAEKHDDGSLEFGGKRYVTATLGGGGECDAILDESYYKGIHGYCEGLKCSNCGEPLFSEFKSCPWCGMTIRKAVER